jgi:hypothetical protein
MWAENTARTYRFGSQSVLWCGLLLDIDPAQRAANDHYCGAYHVIAAAIRGTKSEVFCQEPKQTVPLESGLAQNIQGPE